MTLTRMIARPMLSSLFVAGGAAALRNTDRVVARAQPAIDKYLPKVKERMPEVPIPSDPRTLVRINAGAQVALGLALATGRAPRLSSLALAGTLLPSTVIGHRFWDESDPTLRSVQQTQFVKNVSVLGGLLLGAVDTEGRPGLAWRARSAASDVRREARSLRKAAKKDARRAARRSS